MSFDKYKTRGAYHYQWYEDNTFDYRDCVDACVEFCRGSTIDVGGGDGVIAKIIKDNGSHSLVLDNSQDALNLLFNIDSEVWFVFTDLEDKKSIREAINDPKDLAPYPKYDYMCALNVIEHLEHPENLKYIFDRFVTKAAIIITDIPQGDLPPEHIHEFTPDELKQIFNMYKVVPFSIGKYFHGIEIYK